MEYEVLWGDGPLGLTLRPDLGEDMPPVVGRITRLDSAAALASVAIGDMLVSINGMDTARQGYDHVVDLLQKVPRPATLRFRVPRALPSAPLPRVPSIHRGARTSTASTSSVSSTGSGTSTPHAHPPPPQQRRHEQYTVVWTEGPLGMILRPDDDDVHVPCIRKITGKGAGTGMERARVGDVLVAVNGQETKSLGFRSTISLLKTIRKPAVLKFKRMHRRPSKSAHEKKDLIPPPPLGPVPPGPVPARTISTSRPSLPTTTTNGSGSSGSGRHLTRDQTYDIVWREGDLGLKLKPGHRDVPVLSKLTGKGTASGLQNANVGDELVSVNGVLVDGQAYHDTLRMLKHSQKPAVLRFRVGRDRRTSIMSAASVTSTRSNPATLREMERLRSAHRPVYDSNRHGPVPSSASTSTEERYHSMARPVGNAPPHWSTGERVKKKKRIPLDLAQQVVAASQGVELEQAFFAGLPIRAIQEGTEEAHLLRVEAKMCMTANKERSGDKGNPKEALIRAEEQARVLREALERMQNQAKVYEEALEKQKREQLLASALRNKSGDVVAKYNMLFNELSDKIAGLKRDSYSDVDIVPMQLDEAEHQELLTDLQTVRNIAVVVPSTKFCADCGATEKESKLDLDDDGQYYCNDCWDKFLSTPGLGSVPYDQPVEEEPTITIPEPPAVPKVALVGMVDPPSTPPRPVLSKGDSTSSSASLTRMSLVEREQEEKNARMEAEKKLEELKILTRTGSMRTMERQASMNAADRTRRERRGLEELSQALLEEEERARAEGNLTLAKKLSAQRARTMAEAKAEQEKQNGGSPPSSRRDQMDGEPEFSRYYKHENGMSSSYDGPTSVIAEASSSEFNVPPPVSLKRSVTLDSATPPKSVSPPPAPAASRNDYEDVNSDDEADDQVDMSDAEDDVLREVEEKNMALAKQLNDAHNVIERARESIMLTGDEDTEELTSGLGLSEEQINLFKKLTTQADERMSSVDQFHPAYDSDSDSDSDSDESVMDDVAEGDEDEEEGDGGDDDEDEEGDGGDDDDDDDEGGVWI